MRTTVRALVTLALALPTACVAAVASPGEDSFAKFDLLKTNGLVKLTSQLYDQITAAPRDYSVSIVLTAMSPQFKCQACQ